MNYLYTGNIKEVEKLSVMQLNFRSSVFVQVLQNIEKVQAEKRDKIIHRINSAITIKDLERMTIDEVQLCAAYLPDVNLQDVSPVGA